MEEKQKNTQGTEKKVSWLEELVEVTLFRDGDKYKDDVFVSINDEPPIAIKRGVPVKIKRKYALVLDQSRRQDMAAADYSDERQGDYVAALAEFRL